MRKIFVGAVALVVFHCASGSAHAQLFGLSAPFSSANSAQSNPRAQGAPIFGAPKQVTVTPFNANAGLGSPNYADSIGAGNSRFGGLFSVFRPSTFFSAKPSGTPTSDLPPPSSFQSTRYPNSFVPVAPINPR